jgi:hypothetical protein
VAGPPSAGTQVLWFGSYLAGAATPGTGQVIAEVRGFVAVGPVSPLAPAQSTAMTRRADPVGACTTPFGYLGAGAATTVMHNPPGHARERVMAFAAFFAYDRAGAEAALMAHTWAGPAPVATCIGGEAETAMAAFGDPVNVVGAPVAAEAEPAVMPPRAAMAVRVAAVQIMTLRRMGSSSRSFGCADADHCGQPLLKGG